MKFNKIIPELSVSKIDKSLFFYTNILGFKIEYSRAENRFAFVSYQGSQLMLDEIKKKDNWITEKLKYPYGRGINFQIEVDDIQKIVKSLEKHSYPIMIKPVEHWYRKGKKLLGSKEFLVKDPDGYLLRFAEDIGTKLVSKK